MSQTLLTGKQVKVVWAHMLSDDFKLPKKGQCVYLCRPGFESVRITFSNHLSDSTRERLFYSEIIG